MSWIDEVPPAVEAFFPLALPAGARLEAANTEQVRDGLVACGHTTVEEIDAHLAVLASGLDIATPPLVSCWGRRPASERKPPAG